MEIMNLKGDEYIIGCIKIIMGIFESHFFFMVVENYIEN